MAIIYTAGIEESLNKIFSGILIGQIKREGKSKDEYDQKVRTTVTCLNRFIANFPSNIFQDEYAIFYEIIVTFNAKSFTNNQLESIIENNRDLILDSPYVDLIKYSMVGDGRASTDDEKIDAFTADLQDKLDYYSNIYVSEEDFNSSCMIFIDWFKNQYMFETTQNMTMIMSDIGFEERLPHKRAKRLQGLDDSMAYYAKRIKVLNELSEENMIRTTLIDADWLEQELMREDIPDDKALMTVGIPEIDETLGELRRSNMVGILGPPKGGKTRFTNFLVQRALSLGLNVCVWPLEGTREEWQAMQAVSYLRRTSGLSLDSKYVLQRKYRGDKDLRKKVTAAKTALATSAEMGRLSYIEGVAYVEDFIDILQSHYDTENPYDIIVIDSLVNIQSRTGRGKVERISEAYMVLKSFVANKLKRPALALIPAQLKQDVVDYLRKNPDETLDVTAGGESAETIRTPDEVIGLFSTKEERAAGMMKIYSVASRHSGNFDDFTVKSDFQACHFFSGAADLNN